MLRGGFLAALAGTATVCAGLAYLKPGEPAHGGQASSTATCAPYGDEPADADAERGAAADATSSAEEAASREEGEETLSRVQRCRDGVKRWLSTVTPNTRNMVRREEHDTSECCPQFLCRVG